MSNKEITVTCPCCDSRLVVDVLTARVIAHGRQKDTDPAGRPIVREEDWDTANERVAGRTQAAANRFDEALSQERTRGKDLDALFDDLRAKSSEEEEEEGEEPNPPRSAPSAGAGCSARPPGSSPPSRRPPRSG